MTWRDVQVANTRRLIVETYRELSAGPHAAAVRMSEVARASGVAPATIYRHFPNRDALVSAAATEGMNAGLDSALDSWGIDELHHHLSAQWSTFEDNLSVIREGTVSEAGRELRRSRMRSYRSELEASARAAGIDPDSADGRKYLAAVSLLTSSHAFLDLHDRQEFDAAEAADIASWAVSMLIGAVGADPRSIWTRHATPSDPASPRPASPTGVTT